MVSYSFEDIKPLWTTGDEKNGELISQQSKLTGVIVSQETSPSFLENTGYDVDKWPMLQIMRLLRLYAAHRCLWDVRCKDNHNRKMRQAALIDITAALDIGATKEQVIQKINILKATYRYEKKRIKQRIRRGLAARTKLKWFALADAFLRNVPKKGQKKEDPDNSDSDLEDAIVFTINTESLMPLYQEFSSESFEIFQENDDSSLDTKQNISENVLNSAKKKQWTHENTIVFLQFLENHSVLFENSSESSEHYKTSLESIAKNMNYSFGSIEKRFHILQRVFREENKKILENPAYKPKYKWWPAAEKLFVNILTPTITSNMALENDNVPTELIILHETNNPECSDYEEYEDKFLQNPIPSVAPLSNMTEAMASLFHENNDDDTFSQQSNTNSLSLKESDSSSSAKFIWHGLEDDLLEGKWSLKNSVKFLRLYGVHSCLWDLNDPDYHLRPLRNAAIEDIAASMGHGLTSSYVAKKIKIFRITYMQQRKRLLEATEKGETPEILLKWFPLADSFLRPHIGLRSIRPDAKEIPQFNYQYVYAKLNLIDPALLTDFRGKGTQNAIEIGNDSDIIDVDGD